MSTKDFIENYLFVKCRNIGFNNKNDFLGYLHINFKKLLTIIDISTLYVKVINYQIEKYGGTMQGNVIYDEANQATILVDRPYKRK